MKAHVNSSHLADLVLGAEKSERARTHLNTHNAPDAVVQRLFIATTPDTYIRPHRHSDPHKWEFLMLLEGVMELLIFDDDGALNERARMSRIDVRAVEIPPGTWHSYVCCEPGTLSFEIKQGAYTPTSEDDLAPWSPAENSESCDSFLDWMRTGAIGSRP